jgi:hypothetical protein
MSLKIFVTLLTLSSFQVHAEAAKEAEKAPAKEVVKEPAKEAAKEPSKEAEKAPAVAEAPKAPKAPKKPKECVYQTNALAHVAYDKFDDEVKKIQGNFEKCEESMKAKKEQEMKGQECKKSFGEVKEKRAMVAELVTKSMNLKNKDEFDKAVVGIKTAKEEVQKLEMKHHEACPVKVAMKPEVKVVAEEKKAEVKAAVEEKKPEVKAVVEEKKAEVKAVVEEKKAEVKAVVEEKKAEVKALLEDKKLK